MTAKGGGQPTPDEKKNNFDILKYDIEHYLAKHKHYENTYYLIVGITAALVLFFFYPYSIAVWIGEHINNIQDKIDNVEKNINDIKKTLKINQINFLS